VKCDSLLPLEIPKLVKKIGQRGKILDLKKSRNHYYLIAKTNFFSLQKGFFCNSFFKSTINNSSTKIYTKNKIVQTIN
jgi:hypothetical protein